MSGRRILGIGSVCLVMAAVYACGDDGDGFVPGTPDNPATPIKDGGGKLQFSDVAQPDGAAAPLPGSSIALGDDFSCLIAADRSVWCWGKNDVGQLGSDPASTPACGASKCTPTPTKVEGLPPAATMAAGKDFACIIDDDKKVWCWGSNAQGQLGKTNITSSFTPVNTVDQSAQVVLAGQRACVLSTDGFIFCWGDNSCNLFLQNDADAAIIAPPQRLVATQMTQISLGEDEMCGVTTDDGNVICWGADHNGSLGHPVAPSTCGALTIDKVAKRVAIDSNATPLAGVTDVHVGTGLVCARKGDGTTLCWGTNAHGGLGQGIADGTPHSIPTQVPAIQSASLDVKGETACVIIADRLLCWGDAKYGQMDSIGSDAGCGGAGCRPFGYVIPGQQPLRSMWVGPGGIATIKSDLSVWLWGRNDFGQIGVASTDPANISCAGGSECVASPRQNTLIPQLE